MRKILDAAAPEPAVPTRHKIDAKDCAKDSRDTGAVWAELDTSGDKPAVAITSTEGETPEEYPEGYTTTRLSPAEARQLAAKVRRFAQADPATGGNVPEQPAADPVVEQVRQAYERLADRPGGYVSLADIREVVPTKDHDRVDRALQDLMEQGGAALEPEPFGYRVGFAERQAAVNIGGEDRHHLAIRPSAVSAPAAPERLRQPSSKDPVAVARHVTDLVRENNHDAAALYLESLTRTDLRAVAEAAGLPEAQTPRVKTDQLVAGVLRRAEQLTHPTRGPRRVTNPGGRTYEYDPGTGATAVIESDGWRAVVPPSSPTGTAATLLYWNAEIKDGRGDDATEEAARTLLDRLSAAELREVAAEIGASARGARTKPQLIDTIVTLAINHARNSRALRQL
ncbi:hypothetical protein [Actinoplanes xinjiangensis]|uniref:hypothetical protein n=1 Tax=Actinoplanes xinjiangensis TaxID=512350 RepID=UPI003433175A